MKTQDQNINSTDATPEDAMLDKLIHLKSYEKPDASRMIKNKQNIMRMVRQTEHRSWGLGHLLEVNIPWFFSEPKYGIALLFVAFAALQFWGVSARNQVAGDRGIYSQSSIASLKSEVITPSTNKVIYPPIPDQIRLFSDPAQEEGVMFVGHTVLEE